MEFFKMQYCRTASIKKLARISITLVFRRNTNCEAMQQEQRARLPGRGIYAIISSLLLVACTPALQIEPGASFDPKTAAIGVEQPDNYWWQMRFRLKWPEDQKPDFSRHLIIAEQLLLPVIVSRQDLVEQVAQTLAVELRLAKILAAPAMRMQARVISTLDNDLEDSCAWHTNHPKSPLLWMHFSPARLAACSIVSAEQYLAKSNR